MSLLGVAGGYFVTSGEYTEEARAFASGINLELVDGRKLRPMIDTASKGPSYATTVKESPKTSTMPNCPKCESEMKKRKVRQGNHVGNIFWGCTAYPKCNGTLSME